MKFHNFKKFFLTNGGLGANIEFTSQYYKGYDGDCACPIRFREPVFGANRYEIPRQLITPEPEVESGISASNPSRATT